MEIWPKNLIRSFMKSSDKILSVYVIIFIPFYWRFTLATSTVNNSFLLLLGKTEGFYKQILELITNNNDFVQIFRPPIPSHEKLLCILSNDVYSSWWRSKYS